ncbi:hypothetical protein DFJ58DRAFT_720072 [Suillus subalutaceus]|uniref:uncharacterized protein n=1 Tax=Suillus subalutaceus TaxID=48586 RepID=UPI001B87079B|nr:uncharacterized protein DFJ58DRAFT_720072 [Suillus subalutaceus]KAG1823252.1 hypothetical protein DFJ58DRAFT_720072 [Suillus subalutaceus]
MSNDKNHPSSSDPLRKCSGSALQLGPHKKVASSNPLVLHGQHFGRTDFALCNYPALLTAGILRLEELQDSPIEDYPVEVFMDLIDSYPGLLNHLTSGEEEDIIHVGELLGKGASVLEWLVPRGEVVIPPLSQNIKSDRGFNHEITRLDWSGCSIIRIKLSLKSGETAVRGDQWLMFLYARYDYDLEDPWKGLLRSEILIFITTRSSNAYLHGIKSVTKGSLAYIATQVWFSLSSLSVFSQTDTVTDSENFYNSILDLLEDPNESEEVVDLMMWWTQRSISENSALSKIWAKCAALQEQANTDTT